MRSDIVPGYFMTPTSLRRLKRLSDRLRCGQTASMALISSSTVVLGPEAFGDYGAFVAKPSRLLLSPHSHLPFRRHPALSCPPKVRPVREQFRQKRRGTVMPGVGTPPGRGAAIYRPRLFNGRSVIYGCRLHGGPYLM